MQCSSDRSLKEFNEGPKTSSRFENLTSTHLRAGALPSKRIHNPYPFSSLPFHASSPRPLTFSIYPNRCLFVTLVAVFNLETPQFQTQWVPCTRNVGTQDKIQQIRSSWLYKMGCMKISPRLTVSLSIANFVPIPKRHVLQYQNSGVCKLLVSHR